LRIKTRALRRNPDSGEFEDTCGFHEEDTKGLDFVFIYTPYPVRETTQVFRFFYYRSTVILSMEIIDLAPVVKFQCEF
jgi:hypothetical protein